MEKVKNKMINIRNELIDKGMIELIPYVNSLLLKQRFMLLSYSSIIHAKQKLIEKMHQISLEKDAELLSQGHTSWGVNDRKRWNIDIEGFNVDVIDYVNKNMWDLIHYARICLEMIPQIINVAVYDYDKRIAKEKVDMKIKLPERCSELKSMLESYNSNSCYNYLISADNYLKHIDDINVKLYTKDLHREFDFFEIADFEYKSNQYSKQDVVEVANRIKDFVNDTLSDFVQVLLSTDCFIAEKSNYIMDISYEVLLDGNALKHAAFFIDVPDDNTDVTSAFNDNHLYVRPVVITSDYTIYEDGNFSFDTIFIRQKESRNIIGVAKICNPEDNNYYKKYNLTACSNDDFSKYLRSFKENYNKVCVKNMLAYSGIERRII